MDERFATPRASALSSRSNCSSLYTARSQGSTSSNERWYTPSVSSARSASSFAPMDTVQIHRHNNDAYSFTDRDRARDFRRFDQPHSYRRSVTAVDSSSYQRNYDLAESGGAEAKGRYARLNNPMPSRAERNQDMFSLARHGRAGELEELLLQGVSIESKDQNGNPILLIGCQNGSKRIVKLALRYGADIDAVNSSGNTALHFAFKYGFGETLGRYLISKGASTNLKNNEGRTYDQL